MLCMPFAGQNQYLYTVSALIATTCFDMYNFATKLQKYYPKGVQSISGMGTSEWNSEYHSFVVANAEWRSVHK